MVPNASSDRTSNESCRGVDEIHNDDDHAHRAVMSAGSRVQRNCVISLQHEEETLQLQLSSFTSFHEFDQWVRGRFALPQELFQVAYMDSNDRECIPHFDSMEEGDSQVVIKIKSRRISSKFYSGHFKKSSLSLNWTKYLSFSYLFPLSSFLYLAIFLAPSSPIPNPMSYFSIFSPLLTFLGIDEDSQMTLYREIVTTFIAWPVTYFFIRRSLNPDFGISLSFQKFGSDSFWGAIAACALVILRHLIKSQLISIDRP